MSEIMKDRSFTELGNNDKNLLKEVVNQTGLIHKSLMNSQLFMKYYRENQKDIVKSIYNVLKLIKNRYNLNEVQEYIIMCNIAIVFDKYIKYVKTDDLNICIYRNQLGQMYTFELDEKFINNIKLLTGNQDNLLYSRLCNMCFDDYNLSNHPIFELDIEKVISDSNLNGNDLFVLMTCTRDINLINRYIKLLGSKDTKFNKLLLEFIRPASHYMRNFGYGFHAFDYIKDKNEPLSYVKCRDLYYIYEKKYQDNLYLIKTFEYYFINKIDELEHISRLINGCDILSKMIKVKEELLSFSNIYKSLEYKIITKKEPDCVVTYFNDDYGYDCTHIVEGEIRELNYYDTRHNEIDRIYEGIDDVLVDIENNKEVDLDRFKILTKK